MKNFTLTKSLLLILGMLFFSLLNAQVDLTITLEDSFGDGWNGAEITISDNTVCPPVIVGPFTLADGSTGTESISLANDMCYVIDVTEGGFPTEISWNITFDSDGSTWASGGAPFNATVDLGTPASCDPVALGCTDPTAPNFDPLATCDDGSCVPPPPANDLCGSAEVIMPTVEPGTCVTGTNESATDSGEPSPSCAGANYAGGDIWYSITVPPGETQINYDRTASVFSTTYYALYSGACGALTEEACGTGASDEFTGLTPGDTYYLRLFDWGNDNIGDVTFCISTPAACQAPTAVTTANITPTSVDVSWTAGGATVTSATVWVCPDGDTPTMPGGTCIMTANATNPQTVSGLVECTAYDVFVQEMCGADTSPTTGPVFFDAAPGPPPVPACGGMATDSGSCADYPNGASETTVICPDPGEILTITFTEFEVENNAPDNSTCWDDLQIIIGTTPVPGGGGNNGGFCGDDVSALPSGGVFTGTAADECITLILTSDTSAPEGGFSVDIECVLAPLPVELAYFTGKTMASSNMLEWSTASEENTEWHVIERSNDGRSRWEEVGRSEAKGFSTELVSYELEDTKPLAKSYYRLRSIDFDGHEDISDIVYLERKIDRFDIVKVYPVPTSKVLNIDFETVQDQEVEIRLTDMLGKIITVRPVGAIAGVNTATFDMSTLANGVYFVTINNGQDKISKRVIKN